MASETDDYGQVQSPVGPYGGVGSTNTTTPQAGKTKNFNLARSNSTWEKTEQMFWNSLTPILSVNHLYPTVCRRNWSRLYHELFAYIGAPGERSAKELQVLQKLITEIDKAFSETHEEAVDLFESLTIEYKEELTFLFESELLEDVASREILEKNYALTDSRVLGCSGYLVPEDLLGFHYMLQNQIHLKRGKVIAAKELKRWKKLEKEFLPEEDFEMPSNLQIAWEVVGWSSPGDFASDAALTIVSLGLGKLIKYGLKARKAKKKLEKIKRLNQLRKARKVVRARKITKGASRLGASIGEALKYEGLDLVLYAKDNWWNFAKKYVADELGEALGGGDVTKNKNISERISKEYVNRYVSRVLKISENKEKNTFRIALYGFASGRSRIGTKLLRRYLIMNFKRRLISNMVFFGARLGTGNSMLTPTAVTDIITSTIGDMIQDLTRRFGPLTRFLTDVARKAIKKAVTLWISKGFSETIQTEEVEDMDSQL